MDMSQKEMFESLRLQWKKLWEERAEDRVRAEGIATADYCDLFVDKGTVIHATRDFRSPSFTEVLEKHKFSNIERVLPPDPQIGGWSKFIKMNVTSQRSRIGKRRVNLSRESRKCGQNQPRKGGRGWLHKE